MSLKIIPDCLFSLLFFFIASTLTSVGLIIKSNNSPDNVNKEIRWCCQLLIPSTIAARCACG